MGEADLRFASHKLVCCGFNNLYLSSFTGRRRTTVLFDRAALWERGGEKSSIIFQASCITTDKLKRKI